MERRLRLEARLVSSVLPCVIRVVAEVGNWVALVMIPVPYTLAGILPELEQCTDMGHMRLFILLIACGLPRQIALVLVGVSNSFENSTAMRVQSPCMEPERRQPFVQPRYR